MIINTTNGSFYFAIFYSLAYFVAFMMLLREGYRRKIQIIPWVLLLVFSTISFIVGTKVFNYNQEAWLLMINKATLIPNSQKILSGGIIFGFIALLTGKHVLKIKQNIVDAFALILPLCIGIEKIGCFLNGCCFGKPTDLPFGVQYPVNTLPHFHHYEAGLIGTNDLLSLNIHPVQLYEMAGAFLVAFIVFKSRKYWKANGSLFFFSILLYSFVCFLTEFFRDIQAHAIGGEMAGVLNHIQWTMLFIIVAFPLILLHREKRMVLHLSTPRPPTTIIGIKFCLSFFIFEALLFWALRHWFSPSEVIAILLTFFTSSMIIFFRMLREIASSRTKMVWAGLLLLPLLITSQTIPISKSDSTLVVRTKKISVGLASGNFENSFSRYTGTTQEGCDQYTTEYLKQKYTVGGIAYSIKDEYPEKKYTIDYGVHMYLGQNSETVPATSAQTKTFLYGVNPFVKFDANWIGVGAGIHAGNLVYTKSSIHDEGEETTAITKTSFYPQAYFRFGPKKIIYIDYHFADQFPAPFPCFYQQIGIGSGFGSKDGNLRVGGFISPEIGGYLSAYIPVSKILSLEPMVVLSGSNIYHFSLGIHYNISSNSFYKKSRLN